MTSPVGLFGFVMIKTLKFCSSHIASSCGANGLLYVRYSGKEESPHRTCRQVMTELEHSQGYAKIIAAWRKVVNLRSDLQIVFKGGIVWRGDANCITILSYAEEQQVQDTAAASQHSDLVCFERNALLSDTNRIDVCASRYYWQIQIIAFLLRRIYYHLSQFHSNFASTFTKVFCAYDAREAFRRGSPRPGGYPNMSAGTVFRPPHSLSLRRSVESLFSATASIRFPDGFPGALHVITFTKDKYAEVICSSALIIFENM